MSSWLKRPCDRGRDFLEVVGMDDLDGAAPDELLDAIAEDLLDRAADVADAQIGIDDGDDVGRAGNQGAEASFVLLDLGAAVDHRR